MNFVGVYETTYIYVSNANKVENTWVKTKRVYYLIGSWFIF